jgi:hypothetical protein
MLNLPGKTFDRTATPIDLAPDFLRKLHAERQARLQRMAARPQQEPRKAAAAIKSSRPFGPYLTDTQCQMIGFRLAQRLVAEMMAQRSANIGVVFRASVKAASVCFGVPPDEILSASRKMKVSHARQWAQWLMARHGGISVSEIGRRFNRDHTSVLHSIKAVLRRSPELAVDQAIEEIIIPWPLVKQACGR